MHGDYPVQTLVEPLRRQLLERRFAVLQAPPGAGKTTVLPQALLSLLPADQSIIMLQPRRIAAIQAATRIASLLGEKVGQTVGYAIRFERRAGPSTRIEIVTEGILTRRLQNNPELPGVGLLIFDEFHERSLQSDLGLAFALEAATLRDDLRILVMSATLDATSVSRILNDAPVLKADVRPFNIKIEYEEACSLYRTFKLRGAADFFDGGQHLIPVFYRALSVAVRHTLGQTKRDVLVFLPGQGEIRRAGSILREKFPELAIVFLYGELSKKEQEEALQNSPDRRRLILATNVAQTSLTLEGVDGVIDSCFERRQRYHAGSGMNRLELLRIAKDAARQRAGRAGRLSEGYCLRMCSRAEFETLAERTPPEITEADLAGFLLELCDRGVQFEDLAFLDAPPQAALHRAERLLQVLGALSSKRKITRNGRRMAGLPLHPRLARMLLASGITDEAAALAAILSERDPLRFRPEEATTADLHRRLDWFFSRRIEHPHDRMVRIAESLANQARKAGHDESHSTGPALALGFPDRIARRRATHSTQYLLTNGNAATLAPEDPLCESEWLVVADVDLTGRIRLALPVAYDDVLACVSPQKRRTMRNIDGRYQIIEEEHIGSIVLRSRIVSPDAADQSLITEAILGRICDETEWKKDARARNLIDRVECLREAGFSLPACDDQSLIDDADVWLRPFVETTGAIDDYRVALLSRFSEDQRRLVESLAPEAITVPSGHRRRIDYSRRPPVLAVKLQELFGLTETPVIANGRIPLTLHLLSPAGRPVQVTNDLKSFWARTYSEVRRELRGRYPKHPWPEDPLKAIPTHGTKKKGNP